MDFSHRPARNSWNQYAYNGSDFRPYPTHLAFFYRCVGCGCNVLSSQGQNPVGDCDNDGGKPICDLCVFAKWRRDMHRLRLRSKAHPILQTPNQRDILRRRVGA